MGKPTGFLEYKRETAKVEAPKDRIKHFKKRGTAETGRTLHGMWRSVLPGRYNDCRNGFRMSASQFSSGIK